MNQRSGNSSGSGLAPRDVVDRFPGLARDSEIAGRAAASPAGRALTWLARPIPLGFVATLAAGIVFWYTAGFDAGRPDIFYLSNAFLHGQTGLSAPLGANDVIPWNGYFYVPFAPFPSIFFMPLMVFISPQTAHQYEPVINSILAAIDVGLVWAMARRLGVERRRDLIWLGLLLGFSTAIWWVTVRGGVWHTSHLIATMLTLLALIETFGRRRPLLIGLLLGAAFLTRPPILFAGFFYAYVLTFDRSIRTSVGRWAIARDWSWLVLGVLPSIAFFFWFNWVRFGSPLDSGYLEATLPPWLEAIREQGLFSISHLPQNWDYFMLHTPQVIYPEFPWIKPDGLGMSILITSPALLLSLRADWRSRLSWGLAAAFVLVMIPVLLYYGGGWLQYGFRYALDAIPFAVALCATVLARRRGGLFWWLLLAVGLVVNAIGTYWAYQLH
ncbi:MAG TPA: hypothetical protein VIK06_00930 [Candidatus Limnocylindrales bacterium]|jgi:hypothetical protein